ncbi:aminotransferase class IV, partial [Mesorhizobium sp.]
MSVESALRDGNGAGFELIETMRWEPGSGFLRFERHLARLYASAAELGFACDPERLGEVLSNTVSGHGT